MKSITVELEADLDPFAVGAVGGLLWSGDGCVFGGLGVAQRIPVERSAAGAVAAQAQLSAATDFVPDAGIGPVALTAMPFDPTRAGELLIPEILLRVDADGRRWITTCREDPLLPDEAVERARDAVAGASAAPLETSEVQPVLAPEVWRDEILTAARDRIRAGELTKAVIAREVEVASTARIDPHQVLTALARTHTSATVFCVEDFLGASPERLVSRAGDVVLAHPLAGTMPRGADEAEDREAIERLRQSTKDHSEHRITIDWLLDELLPFCSYVDAEPEPSVISLPNVHHLGTSVEGRLSSPPPSILELVAALHPTPAVGGDPQAAALELIAELEPGDRGLYAGPTGWVDAAGNGSFVVAIRSAQLTETGARLFAGVGVVADSDPEAELAETEAKLRALLPVLAGTAR